MTEFEYMAIEILDRFEDLLERYDITIPDGDRQGDEGEARIYGMTYGELMQDIADILVKKLTEKMRVLEEDQEAQKKEAERRKKWATELQEREKAVIAKEEEQKKEAKSLRQWATEIQEREEAVVVKEEELSSGKKGNSFDYLFDPINENHDKKRQSVPETDFHVKKVMVTTRYGFGNPIREEKILLDFNCE